MTMTIEKIKELVESGHEERFYNSGDWDEVAYSVKKLDHFECVLCKARGRCTTRNLLVHHVNHLKDRPDLALTIWIEDTNGKRQRNLITVCRRCHETVCHPDRMAKETKERFQTVERWD